MVAGQRERDRAPAAAQPATASAEQGRPGRGTAPVPARRGSRRRRCLSPVRCRQIRRNLSGATARTSRGKRAGMKGGVEANVLLRRAVTGSSARSADAHLGGHARPELPLSMIQRSSSTSSDVTSCAGTPSLSAPPAITRSAGRGRPLSPTAFRSASRQSPVAPSEPRTSRTSVGDVGLASRCPPSSVWGRLFRR